jgi:hypothetical protein
MKRVVSIIFVIVVIGLGFWLWTVLFPSPEKVIRSRLNALAKDISFNSSGGLLAQAFDAQKAGDFFTVDADLELNAAGYDPISLHGRDEVVQAAVAARSRLNALKVEFLDMNITFAPDHQSAKVNLTGKVDAPGDRNLTAQEFNFMLKKVDGKWMIYKIESVKTLAIGRTPFHCLAEHPLFC